MRDDREKLLDILEAIDSIKKYAGRGEQAFRTDELIQTWIVHHMQILGEAASKMSEDLRRENPQISWHKIISMRNILIHNYFGIDIDVVWSTVENDLPELEKNIKKLLEQQ